MKVKLTEALRVKIKSSSDVFEVMSHVLLRQNKPRRNKEHFWIICLANNNQILMIELISLGTVNCTIVDPMEVFSFALQKRAVKLILVHNHPSGELKPSGSDRELTEKLLAIGKYISVPILDHVIITEKEYFSFADDGIIEEMQGSNVYDLSFRNISQLKQEIIISKQLARREMAEILIQKGVDKEIIKAASGLTKSQLENLKPESK